jgi:hypothetical protein
MCPACITTAALIVAGATATSGLTAIVVKKVKATEVKSIHPKTQGEQDGSSKSRVTS